MTMPSPRLGDARRREPDGRQPAPLVEVIHRELGLHVPDAVGPGGRQLGERAQREAEPVENGPSEAGVSTTHRDVTAAYGVARNESAK